MEKKDGEGGFVPSPDGSGPVHFAFAVAMEDLEAWQKYPASRDSAVKSRVEWSVAG